MKQQYFSVYTLENRRNRKNQKNLNILWVEGQIDRDRRPIHYIIVTAMRQEIATIKAELTQLHNSLDYSPRLDLNDIQTGLGLFWFKGIAIYMISSQCVIIYNGDPHA